MDDRLRNRLRCAFERACSSSFSTSDTVGHVLQKAFLSGALLEGEVLDAHELTTVFGVGPVPVRQALRSLVAEGIVEFGATGRATICGISCEDVADIYEMRRMAEVRALQLSLSSQNGPALERAEALLNCLDKERDVLRYGILNREFHRALYNGASSKRLQELITALYVSVERYMRFSLSSLEHMQTSQQEHHRLLFSCSILDIAEASRLLDQHIRDGSLVILQFVNARRMRPYADAFDLDLFDEQELDISMH